MAEGGVKPHIPTLAENATFIELHMKRLYKAGTNSVGPKTYISLTQDEVEEFQRIAGRLRSLAPHEAKIKDILRGRR